MSYSIIGVYLSREDVCAVKNFTTHPHTHKLFKVIWDGSARYTHIHTHTHTHTHAYIYTHTQFVTQVDSDYHFGIINLIAFSDKMILNCPLSANYLVICPSTLSTDDLNSHDLQISVIQILFLDHILHYHWRVQTYQSVRPVCMRVRERERERETDKKCVCMCEKEIETSTVRDREREREREYLYV